MVSLNQKGFFILSLLLWLYDPVATSGANHSESMGVLSIHLKAGSLNAPSFHLFSPGVKQSSIYRGQVKSVTENNVTFYRTPDIGNPGNLLGPLPAGVLCSQQATAVAQLDENGSVSSILLTHPGSGYLDKPNIYLAPPSEQITGISVFRSAMAEAIWDTNSSQLSGVAVSEKGRGYQEPPSVTIEGGPHYLKLIDPDSNFSGVHFPILSNSDHMLELNNSADTGNSDGIPTISEVFKTGQLVEVVKGWTLGSLFGQSSTDLLLHYDSNASRADWVYLLKEPAYQNRDSSDYVPHFNDGTAWKMVDSPNQITSHQLISPDQSVIIARRAETNCTLYIQGTSAETPASWYFPEFNRTKLISNPYPTELKISDLIGIEMITEDNSSNEANSSRWLANKEQDLADNIQILNSSGWSTYWHDGTNLEIRKHAKISARAGTGLGGALTQTDFSMKSGQISSISNPVSGGVIVTTTGNHELSNGFHVTIFSALGRLTNENKDQIDSSGNIVDQGEGMIIESPANGKWEITNITNNTFELKDCKNYTDFIADASATWTTGFPGEGYDSNITLELSITGGGGFGARATAQVGNEGYITSITIIHGGLFYTHPPTITVHSGGWRKLGRGNAPINDLTLPPGSGALLIRKHPHGVRSQIPLLTILQQ